jgi:hypothetical protein
MPGSAVTVWRGPDGAAAAYCYRRNGSRHIDIPRVGSFSFSDGSPRVYALASRSTPERDIIDAHRRTVVPLALQALGDEVLHASAVSMPVGVVAFCGPSGVGKSTLACGLRFVGGSATVRPLPFAPRLSDAARATLEADVYISPNEEIGGQPLSAVVALDRAATPAGRADVARMGQLDGFKALFSHALCFSEYEQARMSLMVQRYLRLVATVPTYRTTVGNDLTRLPELLDRVEAAFA